MLRALFCSITLLAFLVASTAVHAQNKTTEKDKTTNTKGEKKCDATITKVDAKKGTITVKLQDKNGKETDKTFKLTEEVRMFDSTGRAAAIDVFQSGNEVLVVEAEGHLKELHKKAASTKTKDKTSK